MRKAFFAALFLFIATSLSADTCIAIAGIQGDQSSCTNGADLGFLYTKVDIMPKSITIVKTLDKASSQLFKACLMGETLKSAVLKPAANETLTLEYVTVTAWSQSGDANGVAENVTLNFTKIEWKNTTPKTSLIGNARAIIGRLALLNGDGQPAGQIQHFEVLARRGSVTTSVKLSAPQPHMDKGFIEIISVGGASMRFQFNGGTLLNGNLRSEHVVLR